MEGDGDPDEGIPVAPWQTLTPSRELTWVDLQDEDAVPLLEGKPGPLLNHNLATDWPGPWNPVGGNPFKEEEWKPLSDPLLGGDKSWNAFEDTGFLLNTAINFTLISKPHKLTNLFGEKAEPLPEPSHMIVGTFFGTAPLWDWDVD